MADDDRAVSISLAQIPVGVTAVMPLRASMVGLSGAFLVLADDDERTGASH